MDEDHVTLLMEMPAEALAAETEAGLVASDPTPIPPDPDDPEAHFIDPVSIIIASTIAVLATRIVEYYLVRDGRGTLVDARKSPPRSTRRRSAMPSTTAPVRSLWARTICTRRGWWPRLTARSPRPKPASR